MKLLVPMAGGDDAFRKEGYRYCKALSELQGRPMIELVWDSLKGLGADETVFVVRDEDCKRFYLHDVLALLDPAAKVIRVPGKTAGAACTSLLAAAHIDCEDELVIANGDQIISSAISEVISGFRAKGLDGGVLVFDSVHPRWSFVRTGEDGLVVEAAEKQPISRQATAGFYYFRRGADFVYSAKQTILKGADVDGQYYVCPVFNEMILRQMKIGIHEIPRGAYVSLATPQNLKEYEQRVMRGERRQGR